MPYEALGLLADLADADVDWIFRSGIEQQVIANTTLTVEGEAPDALYLVLEGLVAIRLRGLSPESGGTLGPGQIVGEMSFLEGAPASATVQAVENSLLLALPRSLLEQRMQADPAFAGRLYRALARVLARRLRATNAALGRSTEHPGKLEAAFEGRWSELAAGLAEMKAMLSDVDRQAIEARGVIPPATVEAVRRRFRELCDRMNEVIGDGSPDPPEVRRELGARLQRELLPYVLLMRSGERIYSKPRGYAGDYLTIEYIYADEPDGPGRLGPLLDRCCLDQPAGQAVRKRRGLLADEIGKTLAEHPERPAHVLSMACGPAREIFDVYETLADPARLVATCLDIDLQALAHVDELRERRGLKRHVQLQNANLVYLATGRQTLSVPPQDLAYSIGLIDYFNDQFVIRLLDFVHDLLRPGGKVILGNFHPQNPTKAFMDHVLDWQLIHRTEDDMNRLFTASKFAAPCSEIRFEEQGINLFAMARRRES